MRDFEQDLNLTKYFPSTTMVFGKAMRELTLLSRRKKSQ